MRIGNKGNITTETIKSYIVMFVLIVVLFLVLAQLYPTAVTAGNSLNSSNAPLGSLFASGGVVWLVIFAGVLISLVVGALAMVKGRK